MKEGTKIECKACEKLCEDERYIKKKNSWFQ